MLNLLSEYGLSNKICKEFEVTIEELKYLAMIEVECQKLANSGKEEPHGDS